MIKKLSKNNSGFTLVEMLIYVAVFALVAGALISFILSIVNIHAKNYVVQEVDSNLRLAVEVISERIRGADGINLGASTFDSDPGVLSLAMADPAKNPTIIDLSSDDGTLRIKEGADSAINLTSDKVKVSNMVFRDLTSSGLRNNIRLEITVDYINDSGDVEYSYSKSIQTSITLRK